MIESLAIVNKILDDGTIECIKDAKLLCGSCQDKSDNCVPEVFNNSQDIVFRVKNELGAKVNDVFRIGIPNKSVWLSSLIAYGIPLLGIILGAILGNVINSSTEIYSIVGALSGLVVGGIVSYISAKCLVKMLWSPKLLGVLPFNFSCKTKNKEN